MDQLTLFAEIDRQIMPKKLDALFLEWRLLPDEQEIKADAFIRPMVRDKLAEHFARLWSRAFHRCPGLPEDRYIWLNEIEPPEYWVLNERGNLCGEHIDKCPYCGADLSLGRGDVVMVKADDGWWRTLGYIKE